MNILLHTLSAEVSANLRETLPPKWLKPTLATLTDRRFSDFGWLFERKFDSEPCLVLGSSVNPRKMAENA